MWVLRDHRRCAGSSGLVRVGAPRSVRTRGNQVPILCGCSATDPLARERGIQFVWVRRDKACFGENCATPFILRQVAQHRCLMQFPTYCVKLQICELGSPTNRRANAAVLPILQPTNSRLAHCLRNAEAPLSRHKRPNALISRRRTIADGLREMVGRRSA